MRNATVEGRLRMPVRVFRTAQGDRALGILNNGRETPFMEVHALLDEMRRRYGVRLRLASPEVAAGVITGPDGSWFRPHGITHIAANAIIAIEERERMGTDIRVRLPNGNAIFTTGRFRATDRKLLIASDLRSENFIRMGDDVTVVHEYGQLTGAPMPFSASAGIARRFASSIPGFEPGLEMQLPAHLPVISPWTHYMGSEAERRVVYLDYRLDSTASALVEIEPEDMDRIGRE